jgi:LPS-assembly protein
MHGPHKSNLKRLFIIILSSVLFCALTRPADAGNITKALIYSSLTSDTSKPKLKKKFLQKTTEPEIKTAVPPGQNDAPVPLTPRNRVEEPPNISDTTKLPLDSLAQNTDTFSLRISKDTLSAPVDYQGEDSVVVLVPEEKIIMYGKTKTVYNDVTLTAPKVEVDQKTDIVTAYSESDSTGYVITRARFEQGENKFQSDQISFNFKTQKGLTSNTFTQQGEMYVIGERTKKVNASTFFVKRGQFTTCNLDEPHFAFRANKMKIINNKVAVTGPVHPEFEGVPIPVYLPFGYFPMNTGRHSGLLRPEFAVDEQRGIGLNNLGYYHVFNDYIDATVRGSLYSYGGWNLNLLSSYRKRYRNNGGINFGLLNSKVAFKGDPDFSKSKAFNVSWYHTLDQKARRGTNFQASVNAGSTKYNRLIPNNNLTAFNNQLNSTIAYSKTWEGKPYNLQLNANHTQNSETRLIEVGLPDASFTVTSINPFRQEKRVGAEKWYEKIGVGYSGSFTNRISFYDTAISVKRLLDTLQLGATHNVPLTITLPPLGAFIVSPGISYQEQWMMRKYDLEWNPTAKKVDTTFSKGFYTARQISTNLSFNTAIYGTYQFKNSRVVALRHVIRPNFGVAYTPNMAKNYYDVVQMDSTGRNFYSYSRYGANIITRGFGNTRFGGISFGIDNTLEMKLRSKTDTGENAERKIRLIDGLSVNGAYNFLEDSFQLIPLNVSLRSTLFDKLNLSASASIDPYQVDSFGRRKNRFNWKDKGFNLGRVTSASLSLSTQFASKPRDESKAKAQGPVPPSRNTQQAGIDPTLVGDQQMMQDYMRRNPGEFVDFNIPWQIGLDMSLSLFRQLKPDFSGFESVVNATSSFNGSFSLTPKWNFTTNGYIDLKTRKLETVTLSINREMHCWQMSINIAPIGLYRYFNITISPKSSLLQDLRVNRTRSFTNF